MANWCLGLALRLYPKPFRRRFGPAMALAFNERLDRERQTRGWMGWVLFAIGGLRDVGMNGLSERRFVRRQQAASGAAGGDMLYTLIQDVRFGARVLAKAPGFTCVAALVLALGIGSTTAVFSIISTLLLAPRPGQPAGEVVGVYSRDRERPDSYRPVSYPELMDLREQRGLFAAVAGQGIGLTGIGEGDTVRRALTGIVTTGFFDTFGSRLALGRDFTLDEERPGADIPVAILSHDLWMRLGGRSDVIGSTIKVNTRVFTVVGVTARGFTGSSVLFGPEIWLPTGAYESVAPIDTPESRPFGDRGHRSLMVVARLSSDRTADAVTQRLDVVASELEREYPVEHERQQYQIAALSRIGISTSPQDNSPVSRVMLVLLALSALVMFISALNVANMLLARVSTRRKELAVRMAIGGSRWRVVRQLVTEGLLLSLVGGAGGVVLATWATSLLFASVASSVSSLLPAVLNLDARPDGFVLGATLTACVVCTLAFSLGPAWRLARAETLSALGDQAGELHGRRRHWTSSVLVTGQVALSLVLLTVAGLFVRMATASAAMDPGFSLDRGILVGVDSSLAGYDRPRMLDEFGAAVDRLRALPGVDAASLASLVPFGPMTLERSIQRVGAPLRSGDPEAEGNLVSAVWTSVGAGYFDSLGLTMVGGREFTEGEERDPQAMVALIDRAVADVLFPNQNPVGQRIQYSSATPDDPLVLEIVGLAPPIRHQQFDAEPGPHVYTPWALDAPPSVFFHVRTAASSADAEAAMLPSIRRALQALNPDLPVLSLQTMPMYRDQSLVLAMMRMGAGTFIGFGLMALFMATIGVYGVKAYLVASRTREISIRVTLGASPRDVLWMVLRQGLSVALVGIAIGLVLSLGVSAAVQGIVLTGGAFDLPVFAAAAGVLAAAVLVASWLPARRATRVPATSFMRA